MELKEIGSTEAVLSSISTKLDGSIKVSLEINPDQAILITNLFKCFASNERLLQVAFVSMSKNQE